MTNNERRNATEIIADYYGYESQSLITIEELSELIKAVSKFNRMSEGTGLIVPDFHRTLQYADLVEELADARLMQDQIIYLMDAKADVEKITDQKLKRQLERIAAAEERL